MGKAQGLEPQALQDPGMAALCMTLASSSFLASPVLPSPVSSPWIWPATGGHVGESVLLGKAMVCPVRCCWPWQHHEMADGSGFRCACAAKTLHGWRILALVNHYERLCNPARPSMGMTPHEALSVMFAQQRSCLTHGAGAVHPG